jgi:nuclease-like protein
LPLKTSEARLSVHDGDTITVMHQGRGERIRLHGIDAPERGQPFCNRAKQFASNLCDHNNFSDSSSSFLGSCTEEKSKTNLYLLAMILDHIPSNPPEPRFLRLELVV